eukprot:jgi/Tetstr1/436899/TSEL_025673.t1
MDEVETGGDVVRCSRNDGKNWRCPQLALPGSRHCAKHSRSAAGKQKLKEAEGMAEQKDEGGQSVGDHAPTPCKMFKALKCRWLSAYAQEQEEARRKGVDQVQDAAGLGGGADQGAERNDPGQAQRIDLGFPANPGESCRSEPKPCEEESMDKQHSAEHAGNGSEDSQPRSLERHTVESGATAEADSASERGNLNELKRKRPVNSDVAPEEASRSVLQDCNMDTSTAGEGQRGADLKETAKHVKHEDVGTSRWQFGASDAGAGGSASENGAGGDLMDMEPADGIECRLEGTDSVEFVRLSEHCNASSLTSYLRQIFSQKLAEEDCNFGVVYQDASGDWMLLQPGEPWTLVVNVSRRLLVTTKQFVTHSML